MWKGSERTPHASNTAQRAGGEGTRYRVPQCGSFSCQALMDRAAEAHAAVGAGTDVLRVWGKGSRASGAGLMGHGHTHAHTRAHTQRPPHTPRLHLAATLPTAHVLSTQPHAVHTPTARHVPTHTTRVLTAKAPLHSRADYLHIHVRGFAYTVEAFAHSLTQVPCTCTHLSHGGLRQRAHTRTQAQGPKRRTMPSLRALPGRLGQLLHGGHFLPRLPLPPQRTLNSGQ